MNWISRPNLSTWPVSGRFALLATLAIVVPALWFGPWIPFLDTIAFAALNSYPPKFSYGPYHYYVFQFTYILPHIFSRLFVDLGISVASQVLLYYLLQALIFFGVIWRLLERLVPNAWIRSVAIAFGSLAFWDGLFLWGGPLAYSLAAALLALVAYFCVREAIDPARTATGLTTLLALLAVMSHPFALLFALILFGLRILLLPATRWKSASVLALFLVLAVVIRNDSPEGVDGSLALQLFRFVPHEPFRRIAWLFTWDIQTVRNLFGIAPHTLSAYFALLGGIRLIGFLTSPLVVLLAKEAPGVRMLAALNTTTAALYFWSMPNDFISMWPQRILSFHGCVTYAAGIAAPVYLLHRWKAQTKRMRASSSAAFRIVWAVPALLIVLLMVVQVPVLRLGRKVSESYDNARHMLLQTGLQNAVVVFSNFDHIQPSYLRCVPFLLFSDPQIVQRNLLLLTEWHTQPRHPTRLAELWLDSGRPRYRLDFSTEDGKVTVHIANPTYVVDRRFRVYFGDQIPRSGRGDPLLTTGQYENANFVYVLSPQPGVLTFHLDRWGTPPVSSQPVFVDPSREYMMRIAMAPEDLRLELNEVPVLIFRGPLELLDMPRDGQNPIGGTATTPQFSGRLDLAT